MLVVVILIGVYLVGNLTGAVVNVLPNTTTTKTFGTPDLIVSDISWNYQQQQMGGSYNIMVSVKNQGTAKASNFEVMVKDTTNNIELFPPVAANQKQARCKLSIDAGQTGVCSYVIGGMVANGQSLPATIQATADSSQSPLIWGGLWQTGVVKESNEKNNVLSAKVTGCTFTTIGKCGNGKCEKEKVQTNMCPDRSETHSTCRKDCPPTCGNGKCEEDEYVANGLVDSDGTVYKWACKADCPIILGDGICDKGEAGADGGAYDCSVCGDGVCDVNEFKDQISLKADKVCKLNPKICKVCAADC
jgi:hypothetical protein